MSEDVTVHEMHYDKNGLNLKLGGQQAMYFLQALIELFEINGGKNFLTMTVHKDNIKYAITIQNCNGEDTPSDKLERMEEQNQRYKQALEFYADESNHAEHRGTRIFGDVFYDKGKKARQALEADTQ